MTQFYSNPAREPDPYSLPDCEVFQLSAEEVAELDEGLVWEYLKRPEFRLAGMNSRVRARMFEVMVEEQGLRGGWFYHYCLPGCLPDSSPMGPFDTQREAIEAAQEEAGE